MPALSGDLLVVERSGTLYKATAGDVAALASPSGSIPNENAALASDVVLTANNTWYSGPSVTLSAGTWLVMASGHYHRGATGVSSVGLRIWNGSAAVASAGAYHASVNGINLQLAAQSVVVLTGSTVFTLQMATTSGNANALMKAALVNNAQGNTATQISAIRLA